MFYTSNMVEEVIRLDRENAMAEGKGGGNFHGPKPDFPRDIISSLHKEILINILSHLHTHEAAATSLLSRSWRYLWRHSTSLSFVYPPGIACSVFPSFVTETLALHAAQHIDRFHVKFGYMNHEAIPLDAWIHHASTRNARQLVVDCNSSMHTHIVHCSEEPNSELCQMPPCLFAFSSLEDLTLHYCVLDVPPFSRLSSLRKVTLTNVCLGEDSIRNLTAGSPRLETLILHKCSGENDVLKIHIRNPTLQNLHVSTAYDTKIYCPEIHRLVLDGFTLWARCRIEDNSSVGSASLSGESMFFMIKYRSYDAAHSDRVADLLYDLRCTPKLSLTSWLVQVIAIRALICSTNQPLNARILRLHIGLKKWELPGIAYLLQNCHYLQSLEIMLDKHKVLELNPGFLEGHDFNEAGYWEILETNSSFMLEHLETVHITGFMRQAQDYLCAKKNQTDMVKEALKDLKPEVEYIKFLLGKAVALKKMTITIVKSNDLEHMLENSVLFHKVVEDILDFPKASENAEIALVGNCGTFSLWERLTRQH